MKIVRLVETTSTNDEAKRGAKEGAKHLTVWVAESQTSGRGRQGRTWSSPRGENLLFSVLLRITCPPARVPLVALVAGLAVRDAVAKVIARPDDVKVKWPNDVLVADKKIAGILVESSIQGTKVDHVVVGIGVNVHTRNFPDELASTATSVSLEGGECDRDALLERIVENLDHDVEHVVHRGLGLVHARLERADYLRGRELDVGGIADGIDDDGRLLVRKPDGVLVRLSSGEVRIRIAGP
jgi:BirA family biotin operon repressor/biotin-[acetyl-CoA-carboxylase] ligase